MSIKFNKVTWYSKWAAIILFLIIIPAWTFYLGMVYDQAVMVSSTPATSFSK